MEDHNWITECPSPKVWEGRIRSTVAEDASGCWVWTGSLDRHGYGRFKATVDGRKRDFSAHRAAWLSMRGPIPYPLMPDHLCRNRACCNPDHMELVTNSVNTLRGDHSNKAGRVGRKRNPNGCSAHGLADGYSHTMRNGRARWVCRICARAAMARFRTRPAA